MTSPDRINNTFTALLCHSTIISENWTSRRVTNTGCTVHDSYVRNLYSQTCILEMLAEQRFKYLSTAHVYCALRILLSFNKSILCIGYLGLRDPEISRFFPDYVKLVISLIVRGAENFAQILELFSVIYFWMLVLQEIICSRKIRIYFAFSVKPSIT